MQNFNLCSVKLKYLDNMILHKYCENINRMGNLTSEFIDVIYKHQYWRKISKMITSLAFQFILVVETEFANNASLYNSWTLLLVVNVHILVELQSCAYDIMKWRQIKLSDSDDSFGPCILTCHLRYVFRLCTFGIDWQKNWWFEGLLVCF